MAKTLEELLGIEEELKAQLVSEGSPQLEAEDDGGNSEVSFSRDDVIHAAEEDLNFLAALAMPAVFEYDFPIVHLTAWQLLKDAVAKNNPNKFAKIALGIPRGHAKTTLLKLFCLWLILFTDRKFILVIGSTEQNAENVITDVFDMLDEVNIKSTFGDWRIAATKDTVNIKKFSFRGRTMVVAAVGANGSVRGLNLKNERPDIMIFDDAQTRECAESIVQSNTLENWFIGTAMKAAAPKGCVYVYSGNMFPTPHCILRKLKENPNWIKFISGAILADGTALWPEHKDISDLITEFNNDIAMGKPEIFFSEVLNDVDVAMSMQMDFSKLADWRYTKLDRPQGKFVIIDPSLNKPRSDGTAIGYFEVYDGKPALIKLVEDRMSPGNTIRVALLMALQNNCKVIISESVAYQASLLYWFEQVIQQLNLEEAGIHLCEVTPGGGSKNSRIKIMLEGLQAQEILLHPDVKHLVTAQISAWNPMKINNRDNILDLLAHAPKCIEIYGALMTTNEEDVRLGTQDEGVWEDVHII